MSEEQTPKELSVHLEYIKQELADIKKTLEENRGLYVTIEEFAPVKNIVYGMVGVILLSVLVALVALVVMK